jgi:hypothetical protein
MDMVKALFTQWGFKYSETKWTDGYSERYGIYLDKEERVRFMDLIDWEVDIERKQIRLNNIRKLPRNIEGR